MEETKSLSEELQKAVTEGSLDLTRRLIDSQQPSLTIDNEYSLLSTAVTKGHVEMVKLLLQSGVRGNETSDKPTPLQLAVTNENMEIVDLLLKHGADPNVTDRRFSALACARGNIDMIKLLVNYGVDLNARDCYGWCQLHNAAFDGDIQAVRGLLSCGADVDVRECSGRTPLYVASGRRAKDVVQTLLDHGADINITDERNKTPFEAFLDELNKPWIKVKIITIVDVLLIHYMKMLSVKHYVSDANQAAFDRATERYAILVEIINKVKVNWNRELAKMKDTAVYENSKLSFYDLLKKPLHSLAIVFQNESIVKGVNSCDFDQEFPMYVSIIKLHFRKGMERKMLIEKGCAIFYAFRSDVPHLPVDCLNRIFSFLTNEDLKLFVEACMSQNRLSNDAE